MARLHQLYSVDVLLVRLARCLGGAVALMVIRELRS